MEKEKNNKAFKPNQEVLYKGEEVEFLFYTRDKQKAYIRPTDKDDVCVWVDDLNKLPPRVIEQNIRNMFKVGDIEKINIGDESQSLVFVDLKIGHFEMDSYCGINDLIYSVDCKYNRISISMHKHRIIECIDKWGHFK